MRGRIQRALSGFYYVKCADGQLYTCKARGKFRREGVSPLVGDRVEVRELGGGEGFVEAVEPRRNAFDRPAAANIVNKIPAEVGAANRLSNRFSFQASQLPHKSPGSKTNI